MLRLSICLILSFLFLTCGNEEAPILVSGLQIEDIKPSFTNGWIIGQKYFKMGDTHTIHRDFEAERLFRYGNYSPVLSTPPAVQLHLKLRQVQFDLDPQSLVGVHRLDTHQFFARGHVYVQTDSKIDSISIHTGKHQLILRPSTAVSSYYYPEDCRSSVSLVRGNMILRYDSTELHFQRPGATIVWKNGIPAEFVEKDTFSINSWVNGELRYGDQPLPTFLRTIGRWHSKTVIFSDQVDGEYDMVTRIMASTPLDDMLQGLSDAYSLNFRVVGDTIYVKRKT